MSKRPEGNKSKPACETIVRLPGEVGTVIRQMRKETGLSQKEAASMCKVGTRFLSDLENGKTSIHLGKTMQVLRAFGLVATLKKKTLADG